MSAMYEVTITSDTDSCSGLYPTRAAAVDAVREAAAVDGLRILAGAGHGEFLDEAGRAVFRYKIRPRWPRSQQRLENRK